VHVYLATEQQTFPSYVTEIVVLESIEKLKQDLTDKYVVVVAHVPELARFEGHVGQVKTVNMNGRALVEFDAWSNIGWYDIEPSYLKVVPKPEPSAAAGKSEAKTAAPTKAAPKAPAPGGEKKLSPLELARLQGAAKAVGTNPPAAQPAATKAAPAAKASGAKPSTADVLAAARGGAKAPAADQSAKPKLSTADILAAARAKAAATEAPRAEPGAPAAAQPVPAAPPPSAEPAQPVAAVETLEQPVARAQKPAATKPSFNSGERPSVPEILAWCRQHDAK
jgi:hypothetical protein